MTAYVRVITPQGTLSSPVVVPKVTRTEEEWKQRLTPDQYRIMRNSGTEPAFCGGLLKNKEEGIYLCAGCDLPLFESGDGTLSERVDELLAQGFGRD